MNRTPPLRLLCTLAGIVIMIAAASSAAAQATEQAVQNTIQASQSTMQAAQSTTQAEQATEQAAQDTTQAAKSTMQTAQSRWQEVQTAMQEKQSDFTPGLESWENSLYELITEGCFGDTEGDEGTDYATLWEELHDMVSTMADNPININTATRSDLQRLPLITDRQIEEIAEYIYRYGSMKTIDELILIESLDRRRRIILRHMVYAGEANRPPPEAAMPIRYRHTTITATGKMPLYKRRGDRNGYLGYPLQHWLRCDFDYGKRLRFGFVAAQDAGEPFFAGRNSAGYDYYSAYLLLRPRGRVESLTIGRYRFTAGMGLVSGASFNLGKSATAANINRTQEATLRPHSSRYEADYLQGAAIRLRLSHGITATAFASYRALDATLNQDGTAATIVTSGYHRTEKEMEKKANTHSATAGTSIDYTGGGLHLGLTAMATRLDRRLSPDISAAYRLYYPAGTNFINLSTHYGYRCHRFAINGETAIDSHGAPATLNTLSIDLSDNIILTLIHRFYSHRYTSLHAGSFSDGGRIGNEHGAYASVSWRPTPRTLLSAYTDIARFARPRYLVSAPSWSADNLVSALRETRSWTLSGYYRLRLKQRDNTAKTMLATRTEHRLRIAVANTVSPHLNWKTQADAVMVCFDGTRHCGYMLSQHINATFRPLQISLNAACFHTDNHDTRLYAYERSPAYTFAFPALSGYGLRYSLFVTAAIARNAVLTLRAATTDYFDRPTIGSSHRTIDRSSMTDVEMQARVRL